MSYKFIEGLSMADIAFEASGKTLKELFESSAKAVTNTMISDLHSIKQKKKVSIKINAENLEKLLHGFLQEIIFYKDAKMLLFNRYDVRIDEKKCSVAAVFSGEKLDINRHKLIVDVKAVTWHMFYLKKNKEWKARVILDV